MKIFLYIGDIVGAAGGAERVFCDMANDMVARGHEVYAVCDDIRSGLPFYPLDDRVQFINLDGSGQRRRKPLIWKISRPFRFAAPETWDRYIGGPFNERKGKPLVKLIREVQPDAVITTHITDYHRMMWKPMLDVPVISMHHCDVKRFEQWSNTSQEMAKNNTCPHLQVLRRSFIPGIQKIYRGSIHVIPNVVQQVEEKDLADLTADKPQKTITMIARLCPEKQQHMLIQAFARLAKNYSEWKVEFYGQPYGSPNARKYLPKLKNMIASFDLANQVKLMGTTDRPLDVLRKTDIFAFPSSAEGWGLALTEAMAVGLPCVGLKTASSVNELIVDGTNGFLADDTSEDLAEKLKILMDNQDLRIKMGKAGHEMMKQYAPEKVWDQWEELITKVVLQHQQRQAA